MPLSLVAYYESIDPAAAWENLAAVPDPHVSVSGDDISVPELDQLVMAAAVIDQTVASRARVHTPSLNEDGFDEYLTRLASGLVFGSPAEIHDRSEEPLQLKQTEAMQFQVLTNPAAAAGHYGLVWLGDGKPTPVTGRIRTIRATAAVALAAGAWVNGAITFPVSLAAGKYQVVGMRANGTNLVAARLLFGGQGSRPGCPAVNDEPDQDYPIFRNGELGVWGEFSNSNPPTLDALGITDTAQELFLDLIQVG